MTRTAHNEIVGSISSQIGALTSLRKLQLGKFLEDDKFLERCSFKF
jgi:hypothetical protein